MASTPPLNDGSQPLFAAPAPSATWRSVRSRAQTVMWTVVAWFMFSFLLLAAQDDLFPAADTLWLWLAGSLLIAAIGAAVTRRDWRAIGREAVTDPNSKRLFGHTDAQGQITAGAAGVATFFFLSHFIDSMRSLATDGHAHSSVAVPMIGVAAGAAAYLAVKARTR